MFRTLPSSHFAEPFAELFAEPSAEPFVELFCRAVLQSRLSPSNIDELSELGTDYLCISLCVMSVFRWLYELSSVNSDLLLFLPP